MAEGIVTRNPFAAVRCKIEKDIVLAQISAEEVGRIYAMTNLKGSMAKARLMFLLAVESGAAYADLAKITPEGIVNSGGRQVIRYERQKSKQYA